MAVVKQSKIWEQSIRYLAGGNANSDEMMRSMVLKLGGSSEHVARVCKESV